ncbi:IclR family transcriptional regulator [Cryobacterium psychrophilum]|uniref:IclR family transcriptional regulator n=1 Tax=Cryobacterium psychrophilum TaxID=41988 RepID=A0A4Y8KQM0_9MICO|nr:IclR family transcriptional regulator [Cryobacterium psychrophilum]TDW29443.1 IclR family transcriptional regulator [Cryobacterium psychrophilum]TFD81419.1 IclR family transcriptional regulator [Cryobacterium psychrophilum]
MSTTSGENSGPQSVDRAVTVLEIIARKGEASVSDVATEVGVHRSTISRLLAVLRSRGMVEVAGSSGHYRLGPNLLRLAGAVRANLEVRIQGAETSRALASLLGETVNIAITQGDSAVNVYQAEGPSTITVDNWVGHPTPLHATSSGKILLAWLPAQAADALLGATLARYTPETTTDRVTLAQQLALARAEGFAITLGELEEGLNAIAAPIRGPGGHVIAALSVSGPGFRLPRELLLGQAGEVIAAAARISDLMGHLG